ncbi:DegT/DnrJ/EryC1/StrS family aminotransferase [Lysobacter niastensis]|uniref:DegT/DnrJ/EryC1/StrS family aminotransferase n=1 Tax=Lysobacter niastensis TaxID=380629 RepID=A0ABS0BFN9_9GAMM|nr:DegT/DnrJ/EryC1/StrS family aminotransferase [Lysobacter niastensis]MBF6025875.1 DegT/DnrJ/EryC1/StrS family aminotransferase [Lysobacter niastensis]
MRNTIPWAEPTLWGREEEYAVDALRSTWISGGPYVDRLEADFARYADARNVLAVANGTAALHLAYLGAGIGAGDEVIVPGFAFMAAANMARMVGATPVFADIDPDTWCITAETVAPLITSRTRAIVPVHTYGNVCALEPLLALGDESGVLVIEDAAESIGSKYRGRMSGTIAPMGTYSFHATKTITTGEGGAVTTGDDALADRMRLYRSHGMARTRYMHEVAGHNFRLTNLQAAIGCAQLEQIDRIVAKRGGVWAAYTTRLQAMPGLSMQKIEMDVDPVMWAVGVRLDPAHYPQGRDAVMGQMDALGIETRPGFYPASAMPHLYGPQSHLPVSDALAASMLVLPSSPSLDDARIHRICDALASLAG